MNQCTCGYPADILYRDMATVKYMDAYDSYYCEHCDAWLDSECKCGNEDCWFTGRPANPSDHFRLND